MTEREKQLTELVEKQAKIIKLLEQKVDYLIRKIYGSSSEKLDPAQLHLAFEEEFAKKQEATNEESENVSDADLTLVALPKPKRPPRKEPKLPENLPIYETILIPEEVKANPDDYYKVSEKITDKLDIQQASFSINRTIRPVYTKKGAIIPTFLTAPLLPSLLEKSLLSPSLLSHIICSKYCDHLPLYRQQQILARRHHIHLSRSTLCDWIEIGANWLEPLWKLIATDIRTSQHIQIDETPVDYLDKAGAKHQGYFWVYSNTNVNTTDAPLILYDWQPTRAQTALDTILCDLTEPNNPAKNFSGDLQCDGYSGYQTWGKKQSTDVNLLGCWVHARRKFYEARDQHPDAITALSYIAKIYHQEHRLRDYIQASHHPPDQTSAIKMAWRKRHSRPIAKQLHQHISKIKQSHLPKSNLGKAITYALNQWQKLTRTLSSGHFDLDNNKVENAVRPLKLGAKNWLFIGREEAGWRSAVLYTMIENLRSQGKDPYAYLKWVFERIPSMTNQDDLRQLLPKAWLEKQQEPCSPVLEADVTVIAI